MKLSFALLILIVPLVLCVLLLLVTISLLFQRLFRSESSRRTPLYSKQVLWEDDWAVA